MSDDVDQSLVDKVKDVLMPDETAICTIKTKVGNSAIVATDRRVIIRDTAKLIGGANIIEFEYSQMSSIRVENGMMMSTILLTVPGVDFSGIKNVSKKDAAKMHKIISAKIADVRKNKNSGTTVIQEKESPMDALKMRLIKGEITKEEFEEMKEMLK